MGKTYRTAFGPCGIGVRSRRVTQHHEHLIRTLGDEVITRRHTAEYDHLERLVATPGHLRAVVVVRDRQATGIRLHDVREACGEAVHSLAVVVQGQRLVHRLVQFAQLRCVALDGYGGGGGKLVLDSHVLARQRHIVAHRLLAVVVDVALERIELIRVRRQLLIYRIAERILHFSVRAEHRCALLVHGIQRHGVLCAVQILDGVGLHAERAVLVLCQLHHRGCFVLHLDGSHVFESAPFALLILHGVGIDSRGVGGIDGRQTEIVLADHILFGS